MSEISGESEIDSIFSSESWTMGKGTETGKKLSKPLSTTKLESRNPEEGEKGPKNTWLKNVNTNTFPDGIRAYFSNVEQTVESENASQNSSARESPTPR